MGVVVELTEQARMPSQQTISPSSPSLVQPCTQRTHSLGRCARTGVATPLRSPLVRLGPEGLATHEVSGQTSPGASLSQQEASCVQSNISIWLRRSPMGHARARKPCLLFNLASTRTRRLRRYAASARIFSLHHHPPPSHLSPSSTVTPCAFRRLLGRGLISAGPLML
jgi:hypothetical protein